MNFVFIQNAAAGHDDAASLRHRLSDGLSAAGLTAQFVTREDRTPIETLVARAADQAAALGATLVAIGGDGTVNQAASAAMNSSIALGIVPAGTYNFVARVHGIPEDPDDALEMLMSCPARATRVGYLNERPFLVNASIGLYAKLLSERETISKHLGRRRAVASLAATISALRRHRPLEVLIRHRDTERLLKATTFIIGNNHLQLELVGVADLPDPVADELSAVILHPVKRATLLAMIWRGLRGEVADTPELESFVFERMQVDVPRRRARRITVAIDGEIVRENLPLTLTADNSLKLIRPPSPPQRRRA